MLLAKNRRATYDYEIIEKYMAGIVLKGHEVKAIREKNVNLAGSYIKIVDNAAYVVGMNIGKYSKQSQEYNEKNSKQSRKLLLNNREMDQIKRELHEKGKTAVPLALVLRNNLVKLEFAVVKGRKKLGKKHLEKERQIKKELDIQRKNLFS